MGLFACLGSGVGFGVGVGVSGVIVAPVAGVFCSSGCGVLIGMTFPSESPLAGVRMRGGS